LELFTFLAQGGLPVNPFSAKLIPILYHSSYQQQVHRPISWHYMIYFSIQQSITHTCVLQYTSRRTLHINNLQHQQQYTIQRFVFLSFSQIEAFRGKLTRQSIATKHHISLFPFHQHIASLRTTASLITLLTQQPQRPADDTQPHHSFCLTHSSLLSHTHITLNHVFRSR